MGKSKETVNDIVEDTGAPPDREDTVDGEDNHPAGVTHVLAILGFLLVAAAIPYFIPGLEVFRAWMPGHPLPFAGLFEFRPPTRRPGLAGQSAAAEAVTQSDDELLAAALLPDAGARRERRRHRRPRPRRHLDADVSGADAGSSGDAAPANLPPAPPRIPENRLAGISEDIEEFEGDEMLHFYQQLAAVGRREEGALARMFVYSVSTNGSDRVTSAMRHQLHEVFGDGGKGWVHIAPGWTYQGHRDVVWDVHNWRTAVVNRGRAPLGRYGLGGVLATNMGRHSSVTFGTMDEGPSNRSLDVWRIFYQAWPEGGDMLLQVDGEDRETISTQADEPEDRVHQVDVGGGEHEVSIRVDDGALRLYGATMETNGPGVVVDGLMLIGASARSLHNFDEAHIATQVEQRHPDLMVFWLGGNDVRSSGFTPDRFFDQYRTTINRVRAGRPEASCLVISVLDKGEMENGTIRTRAYVEPVVATQERVARDQGCAFFNLYEATGGRGTARRWFNSAPRLVVSDYTHLTEAGARVVGTLMARALLQGYDDYLADGGR